MKVQGKPDTDLLVTEAATAISIIRNSTDLDTRIGVLKDRAEVADNQLVAFMVTMPEGYSQADVEVFKRFITDTLEKLTEEAHEQVKFERTWNKLGDES